MGDMTDDKPNLKSSKALHDNVEDTYEDFVDFSYDIIPANDRPPEVKNDSAFLETTALTICGTLVAIFVICQLIVYLRYCRRGRSSMTIHGSSSDIIVPNSGGRFRRKPHQGQRQGCDPYMQVRARGDGMSPEKPRRTGSLSDTSFSSNTPIMKPYKGVLDFPYQFSSTVFLVDPRALDSSMRNVQLATDSETSSSGRTYRYPARSVSVATQYEESHFSECNNFHACEAKGPADGGYQNCYTGETDSSLTSVSTLSALSAPYERYPSLPCMNNLNASGTPLQRIYRPLKDIF